jgi:hypothetical protein
MQTTLVVQNNVNQVVLTPENEHERNILKLIESKKVETTLKVGNFNECKGGWIKYYPLHMGGMFNDDSDKFDSLMIVLREKEI